MDGGSVRGRAVVCRQADAWMVDQRRSSVPDRISGRQRKPGRIGQDVWDGIVGVKGRYAFGDNRAWSMPFYLDVGHGQSEVTWQVAAGLGYSLTGMLVRGNVAVPRLPVRIGTGHRSDELRWARSSD